MKLDSRFNISFPIKLLFIKVKGMSANLRYKTQMCSSLETRGFCPHAKFCNYAHSSEELRTNSSYKTKLCRFFMDQGSCPHGDQCHYAHGDHELKVHSRFKTARCQNYWRTGECPWGSTCNYYHSESEKRSPGPLESETSADMEKIMNGNRKSSKGKGAEEYNLVLDDQEVSFEKTGNDNQMASTKVSVGTNTDSGFPSYDEWTCDYGPKLSEVSKYLSKEQYLEYLRAWPQP